METTHSHRFGLRYGLAVALLAAAWSAGTARGQQLAPAYAPPRDTAAPSAAPALADGAPAPDPNVIDVQADSLSYDAVRNLIVADGAVRVTKGLDSVEADYAEVDTVRETVYAKGNLCVRYQGSEWRGAETHFNFRTGLGDFGAFSLRKEPFTVIAEESHREDAHRMSLSGVILTTCEPDNPEYSVRASWASLEDESIIRAKHVRFQLGPVPFFYFPYIKANIHWFDNFEFTPGYSSTHGAFLLTAYRHRFNDTWTSRTHLDIRTKRGVGLGEDILWDDPGGAYEGIARAYWINDRKPWKSDSQKAEREELIEDNRYWLRFGDRHNITDRDYLLTELNYVSDPWMLHDFFDDTYQKNVQPENRVTLTHRGDLFTAGIGVVMRLNDFYSNVSRLPEVSFDVNRVQILETPFYYESANTMGFLKKEYSEQAQDAGNEDYDAFRLDTRHMVYWPTRSFGFLSIVPRAGYRGTYYSKTLETAVYTNVVAVTNEMGLAVGTTNETETVLSDGSSVWRNLPEFGAEASFTAFGMLMDGPTGIEEDQGLRHVAEPYADWTLRLKPNVHPDELWQFDSVDALDKRNTVLVGMKNYLQTKRKGRLHNLIYADVYTTLNLDPDKDNGEDTLENVGAKAELLPFTPFYWNLQGVYDVQDSRLYTFDTQAGLDFEGCFRGGVDYRFKDEVRESIAADVSLFPEQRWEARVYARVDLEENEIEEHSYYLIHRTKCLGIGLGLRIRPDHTDDGEDDYSVWFRIWPLAFPQFFSEP